MSKDFAIPSVFHLKNNSGETLFKIMENIEISKDKLVTIHNRHLQQLAIEIFKVKMEMSPILMNEIFNFCDSDNYNLGMVLT